jgi:hypothetical protein
MQFSSSPAFRRNILILSSGSKGKPRRQEIYSKQSSENIGEFLNLPGSKVRLARKTDIFTAIYKPIVYIM